MHLSWCYYFYFFRFRFLCVFHKRTMAPQVTINFNELPVTFMIKRRMFQARKNVQVIFTVGPRSILAEFLLSNSVEPLRGLKKASKLVPKTDKLLTKKAMKNSKRNKYRSDKHRTKSGEPKLAPSPALELVKTTLSRASQQRPSLVTCPSMAMPLNIKIAPRLKPVLIRRGTLTREAPPTWTTLPRQVWVPNLDPRQAWDATSAPR